METVYPTNCACTLSAIRVLMRIEQLGDVKVGLETLLEVMEDAENRCYAVLNCAACCQRRFSLASVTVVSATVIEWVRGTGLGAGLDHTVSLGDVRLDRADAEMLSRELMQLQLRHFVQVMARLESALTRTRSANTAAYQELVRAKMQELQECKQQVPKWLASDK